MSSSPSLARSPRSRWVLPSTAALVAVAALAGCSDQGNADPRDFGDLTSAERVYDDTGDSLTQAQSQDVAQQLETLRTQTGADVVVFVRELDADPEDTLDQVEALQQAWVTEAEIDQDIAGAILINREPGTDDEARAGIFVGSTFDDGNVPSDEQEAIVEDALVPPLRDGDVAGSLAAGIDRLGSSIVNGPPEGPLDGLADGPGSTWLPWAGLALVLVGCVALARIVASRPRPTQPERAPTLTRPDHDTTVALAGALACGAPQVSIVPAVVLDLAGRDALVIEQERQPSWLRRGTVRLRLMSDEAVRAGVERVIWDQLGDHAKPADPGRVVSSKALTSFARDSAQAKKIVVYQLRERGWLDTGHRAATVAAGLLAGSAMGMMIGAAAVAAAGAPEMLLTVLPAGALALVALLAATTRPQLSTSGQDAALPWEAYRDGLKGAAKDEAVGVDLDVVLPDVIAMNLGNRFKKRLVMATDSSTGATLKAFTGASSVVLPWTSFSYVFASATGSGLVSSGGAGGGGGASGGT